MAEFEPEDWRDPLRNVKPPRVDVEPLEPVPLEHVRAMLDTCERGKFTGERDRAILLFFWTRAFVLGNFSPWTGKTPTFSRVTFLFAKAKAANREPSF
jgi:hypothetical protein